MAKRFTDTEKWMRPWFRTLPVKYKLLWLYILDHCDIAGVWYVDLELAEMFLNEKFTAQDALKHLGKQILVMDNSSRWFVKDFIAFQYVRLRQNNPPHLAVLKILEKHSLADFIPNDDGSSRCGLEEAKKKSAIYEKCSGRCVYCDASVGKHQFQVDHIQPSSKGGSNKIDNLVVACVDCNRNKNNRPLEEFARDNLLDLNTILSRIEGLPSPLDTPQDKDKDKAKNKDKTKAKDHVYIQ